MARVHSEIRFQSLDPDPAFTQLLKQILSLSSQTITLLKLVAI